MSSDVLIAQVSEGAIDYAIVPSRDASAARNIHLDFDVAFPAGRAGAISHGPSRPGSKSLRDALDAFIARLRGDGTLARLVDRYNAAPDEVERVDAGVFQDRIRQLLPQWRRTFVEAQAQSGIEWRLLAAVAYQESQWDPPATSETGVRGFMQITADTARGLGVADRLDPGHRRSRAARYIADLKSKLPARIAEPDRTWLALAAFNIGIGHLEDARILAQRHKLNPDLWSDVRKMLPLLADPEVLPGRRRTATRAAACRWRSSNASAATTTSCCARQSAASAVARRRALRCADATARSGIRRRRPCTAVAVALRVGVCARPSAALAHGALHRAADDHRSAGGDRRGQDDDHHSDRRAPSRTARTWCSASTTSASASSPAGSRRHSATRWSRRSSPTCPRAASTRRSSHMRFAGHDQHPGRRVRDARSKRRRAASPLHGFRDIVFIGDHGGYQSSDGDRREAPEPRMGAPARACACDPRVLPGHRDRLRARR